MCHTCPVCGYPSLAEPPRGKSGGGSYEICPSCGFQFGVSDEDAGQSYAQWRSAWRKAGMQWSSRAIAPPPGWDPETQLRRLASPGSRPSARRQRRR